MPVRRKSACGCVHHEMWEGYTADQLPVRDDIEFVGASSEKPNIVSCGGVIVDVPKTSDTKVFQQTWFLHYPFSIHELQIEKLLRKQSYSVMGRIDMLTLLESLLAFKCGLFGFKVNAENPVFVQNG